jgi:hypothetical protein
METIAVALIVAIVAPALLSILTARQNRANREADYARQDLVAEKVERAAGQAAEAALLLKERQEAQAAAAARVAERLLANNARDAEDTEVIKGQLKEIHFLVNSTLSAAKEAELYAEKRSLVLLRRETERFPEDVALLAEVKDVAGRVEDLTSELADRATQTELAARQLKRTQTHSDQPI